MNGFVVPLETQPEEKNKLWVRIPASKKEAKGEKTRMRVGSRKPLAHYLGTTKRGLKSR
jgi:hypothetical protein